MIISKYIILTGAKIDKKNIFVHPSSLFKILETTRIGVPSLLNHDIHRWIGIMMPEVLIFNSSNVSLLGRLITANSEEGGNYITNKLHYILKNKFIVRDDYRNKLLKLFSAKVKKNIEIKNIGQATVAMGENLVRKKYPEIFKEEDKDGLIPCSTLQYVGQGVFKYKDVILFASKYFRRSMSVLNNFNEDFLDYYFKLEGKFAKKIAIDDSIIGLYESLLPALELDYWWGPKFNQDILTMANGVTRHISTETSTLRTILGIDYTDFRWYQNKENKKVFECEEVLNIAAYGIAENKFCNKYSHAIFVASNLCEHLDGAIRTYDANQIAERNKSDLAKYSKEALYNKIWRVDGEIEQQVFLSLIHHYYRSNTLISEYFNEANVENEILVDEIKDGNTCDQANMRLAGRMNTIIASVGFIKETIPYASRRHVAKQYILFNENAYESSIVDLFKICRQNNITFTHEKYILFEQENFITTFPVIYHAGINSFDEARSTVKCIKDYIKLFKNDYVDRTISFTLACQIEGNSDEFVSFSFCGSLEKMYNFLKEHEALPQTYEKIGEYCDSLFYYLEKNSSELNLEHDSLYFLNAKGKLCFVENI